MIKAKLLDKELKPKVGTEHSAGADLRCSQDFTVNPGGMVVVGTGVAVAIPEGHVGLIFPRSSMGKVRVGLANTVGVIDADYRGEIKLMITNDGGQPQTFFKGDRLAQLVVTPILSPKFIYVDDLDSTERGDKGFGSTGKE